jgi:hypothetical protein
MIDLNIILVDLALFFVEQFQKLEWVLIMIIQKNIIMLYLIQIIKEI